MSISFGLGQDCTVTLVSSAGATYSFSTVSTGWLGADLMDFQVDPINNMVKIEPIGNQGYTKRRTERKGWKGTMNVTRVTGAFEALEIQAHNDYHQGVPETTYSIHTTISESDGSGAVREYEITNCTIMISKGANYRTGEPVSLTLEFEGDDCIEQGALAA